MIETQGEKIARLDSKMQSVEKEVTAIRVKVDKLLERMDVYVRLDDRLQAQQKEIADLKKQVGIWRWLSPTLAAVAGSILTFLIIEYLRNS